ncbi:MAG: hypothetical protein JWP38_444 [Herbaspirillum sp.]|nr:hypothetical protein [Herbaspirillum sp.]
MNRFAAPLFSAVLAACAAAPAFAQQTATFPVIPLNAGMYVIQAEVASTEAQREQGLMFRKTMEANHGMAFVFGEPAGVCMWMKNTLLPLSVAFLDADGRIINIEDMKEETIDSHCATQPATYALEMNLGWFKQKNIKPGTIISGFPH